MLNKILFAGENLIKWIALLFFVFLGGLMLLFRNSVSFDFYESSTITRNGALFYLILIGVFLLLFSICLLLKRIPEKGLFWFFAILYWIGGIYLITHIQMEIRADASICYANAISCLQGEFYNFQIGEYFYKNPHQVGLMLYDCLLVKICDDVNFAFFVNLLWIIVGNFFIWRTVVLLNEENELLRKITILFTFLFMPRLFFIFFAYGLVSGFECILIATYFLVRGIKKESSVSLAISTLFLAVACVLKINFLIAGIAYVLILFYETLKKRKIKYFIASVCMCIFMFVPTEIIKAYLESVVGTDLHQGMPNSLYIAMGLQDVEGAWRAAGWFNDYHHQVYFANSCNPELANAVAIETIKERLAFFVSNPGIGLEFFWEKLVTMWCEPTYQSVWSGPMISLGGLTEVGWLEELYSGGENFMHFSTAMHAFNIILFAFAAGYLLWSILHKDKEFGVWNLFNILFFIGGFVFHIFWEAKSQYVYTYVVCVLPLAAQGVMIFIEYVKQMAKKKFRKA